MLALTCGIPEHQLRVVAPDVGGGFGSKLNVYAEEVIAAGRGPQAGPAGEVDRVAQRGLPGHDPRPGPDPGRRDRRDPGRQDPRALVDLMADMGAYLQLVTPGVPVLGAFMYNAIYKMDAYRFGCTGVFTTKTPTDAYRGAGRPEATYAIERHRGRPGRRAGHGPDGAAPAQLDQARGVPVHDHRRADLRQRQLRGRDREGHGPVRVRRAARRAAGAPRDRNDPVQLGIGISTFTEMCGLAPSRVLGSLSYGAGGWEAASIRMLPTGKVEVVTGTTPHGQGHVTAWSQIAADALGVPVRGHRGDPRRHPVVAARAWTRTGRGRWSSAASRCVLAAREGRRQGPQGRRPPARGDRGRRRLRRRHVLGPGHAGREDHDPGGRVRDVRGARPARRHRADARRRRHPRPGELLLPARHPPVRGRGRHRDRPGDHPQVRRGGRHRQRDQPADRRGPGARRRSPRASPRPCTRRRSTTPTATW